MTKVKERTEKLEAPGHVVPEAPLARATRPGGSTVHSERGRLPRPRASCGSQPFMCGGRDGWGRLRRGGQRGRQARDSARANLALSGFPLPRLPPAELRDGSSRRRARLEALGRSASLRPQLLSAAPWRPRGRRSAPWRPRSRPCGGRARSRGRRGKTLGLCSTCPRALGAGEGLRAAHPSPSPRRRGSRGSSWQRKAEPWPVLPRPWRAEARRTN